MMTIPERIGAVVRLHGSPMTSEQIAAKMRRPVKKLNGQISRAHSYGYLKLHSVETVGNGRLYWWQAGEKASAQ